ncbi:MAG TPA: thioredoxin [Acidobacteriota bacterium]|nr:thioredoxin [Acidobacteriota bacterium]
MADIASVTDANWDQEVVKSNVPVLVDFWAEWCGPCHALAPTVEAIAGTYSGRMKVTKLNVDENDRTAAKYGVRSIPTLILFKGGEVKEVLIGNRPKNEITQVLDKHV